MAEWSCADGRAARHVHKGNAAMAACAAPLVAKQAGRCGTATEEAAGAIPFGGLPLFPSLPDGERI
jgi:hypothetical protein